MNDLIALQDCFQNYLTHNDSAVAAQIKSTETLLVNTRLSIYANAYRQRLQDIIKSDYPVTAFLLGDRAFIKLVDVYIMLYPSHFRSARWVGRYFPLFLAHQFTDDALFAEMARFEWILTEAFDAADSSVIDLTTLMALPIDAWPTLRLTFIDSLRTLRLKWNVVPMWQAYQAEQRVLPPKVRKDKGVHWVIWRHEYQVKFRELSDAEGWAINSACNQEDFSSLCSGLCNWFSEEAVAMQAASLLKTWITQQLISQIISV